MCAALGGLKTLGQPAALGGLQEQGGGGDHHKEDDAECLEGAKDTEARDEQRGEHRGQHGGAGGRSGQGDAGGETLLVDKPLLTRGECRVVAQAVADSGDEREPQVELPRLGDGAGHEPAHAVAHGGGDHNVARADLIGDATGEDTRHGHDGLEDRESPGKSAGPLGIDGEQVLGHDGVQRDGADEEHGDARGGKHDGATLVGVGGSHGTLSNRYGGGAGVSAVPPCQVGLLVSRLCDAGLVGPKLDTLVLEVVVGKGAAAAGLGGEVAHHVGEAAVDLDGVAGGKV